MPKPLPYDKIIPQSVIRASPPLLIEGQSHAEGPQEEAKDKVRHLTNATGEPLHLLSLADAKMGLFPVLLKAFVAGAAFTPSVGNSHHPRSPPCLMWIAPLS